MNYTNASTPTYQAPHSSNLWNSKQQHYPLKAYLSIKIAVLRGNRTANQTEQSSWEKTTIFQTSFASWSSQHIFYLSNWKHFTAMFNSYKKWIVVVVSRTTMLWNRHTLRRVRWNGINVIRRWHAELNRRPCRGDFIWSAIKRRFGDFPLRRAWSKQKGFKIEVQKKFDSVPSDFN